MGVVWDQNIDLWNIIILDVRGLLTGDVEKGNLQLYVSHALQLIEIVVENVINIF